MTLRMTVWNVEHGSAIHLATPNGRNIVIDLGRTTHVSPLVALKFPGRVPTIDYLVVTHPHLDHIKDILSVDDFNIMW